MHVATIEVCVDVREISPGLFAAHSPMVKGVHAHGRTVAEALDDFERGTKTIKEFYEQDELAKQA